MVVMLQRNRGVRSGRGHAPTSRRRPLGGVVCLAIAVSALAACSSSSGEGDDWSAAYVDNPDRVWSAIHVALEELGYEVESENRFDGTIRAVEVTDPPSRGFVLDIDQIQRTEVVRIHVRPSGGAASGPGRHLQLDQVVREFLAALDTKLGRRPPP